MIRIGTILLSLSFISFCTVAQEEHLDKARCRSLISNANDLFSQNKYFESTSIFLKSELGCSDFNIQNYTRFISALKNSISAEPNKERKKAYIDTLVQVYDRCESKNMYDETNDFNRATYILKSNFPNHQKSDSLFVRAISNRVESIGENNVTMYYFNLYTLYSEASIDSRADYKKRLINEFFRMNDLVSSLKMSEQTGKNLSTYLNNVIKNYQDILPDLNIYLTQLPVKKEEKILQLINYKQILEYKSFEDSEEYSKIIDSLLSLQPTRDLYVTKAKIHRGSKDYQKEMAALTAAKTIAGDLNSLVEVDYLIANCFFHLRDFSQAYQNSISMSGLYADEAKMIAAESVISLKDSCGVNLMEQKLNYIYAYNIVSDLTKKTEMATDIMEKYQENFPTDIELSAMNLKRKQRVYLQCLNVEIVIP